MFCLGHEICGILAWGQTHTLYIGRQSLNHWLPGKSHAYSYELSKHHLSQRGLAYPIPETTLQSVWRNFIALRCVTFSTASENQVRCFSFFVFCIPLVLSFKHNNDMPLPFFNSEVIRIKTRGWLCNSVSQMSDGHQIRTGGVHCLFWKVISPKSQLLFQNMGHCSVCSWNQHLIPRGFKIRSFSSILFFNVRAFASIAIEKKKEGREKKFIWALYVI